MQNAFRKKLIRLLFFLISLPVLTQAQSPNYFRTQVLRDQFRWLWIGELKFSSRFLRQSDFNFSNVFSSDLLSASDEENKWKDNNNLAMDWFYPISTKLFTRTILTSQIFSDENTRTEFHKNILAQELSVQLHPKVKFKPALGWTVEEVFGTQDQGWYSQVGLVVSKLDINGYVNTTDFNSVIKGFPGRKNQTHSIYTGWQKQFSNVANDSLWLGYQFSEKRYYLIGGIDQEQVIINDRFINNLLNYRTSSSSRFTLLTSFKNRDIDQSNPDFNNRRKEILFSNQFDYRIFKGPMSAFFGILFSQIINDNPGIQTDIDALQSALTGRLVYRPTSKDVFRGRISYSKFEYDTPDENNVDDRDEQRYIIDGSYQHFFSPFFSLKLTGNLYLYHQIFINALRSGNNNWNRIYQLALNSNHNVGESFQHRNQLKIWAYYTVFDFDEILPQTRSFIFRRLAYADTLTFKLTEEMFLNTVFQWESEDNGTFFKQRFAQQINNKLSAYFINFSLYHTNIHGFELYTGIHFFWRNEWNYVRENRKTREFRDISPRITLIYSGNSRLILFATYAPHQTTNFGTDRLFFTTARLSIQYFL
jgi:hypothetical protein